MIKFKHNDNNNIFIKSCFYFIYIIARIIFLINKFNIIYYYHS